MALNGNYYDCADERRGTGVISCIQETGILDGWIETDLNWSMDKATETWDLDYVQQKIQEGVFVPFLRSFSREDQTGDNTFETSEDNIEVLVDQAKPKFNFGFKNDYHWNASAHTHTGYANKAVILVWKNGVYGFKDDGDTISGLRRGQLSFGTFKTGTGAEKAMTSATFQLINEKEYNRNMYLISEETTDFTISDIKGVVDATLTYTTNPVDAGTTLSVSIVQRSNTSIAIEGIPMTDIKVNGVLAGVSVPHPITSAPFDPGTKTYTINYTTATSTGEVVTVSLNDGTNDIILPVDVPYKGKTNAYTI